MVHSTYSGFSLPLQNGVKVFNGTPLPVFSEEDVFKYLNVQYRDAKERDWD